MLIFVFAKNYICLWVMLNHQMALAPSLLQWDLVFLLVLILIIQLPAHEFTWAPKHTLLLPFQEIWILSFTYNQFYKTWLTPQQWARPGMPHDCPICVSSWLSCGYSICEDSLPQHCNLFGMVCLLPESIVSETPLSNGRACGNIECGHVQVGEWVLFICPSPSFNISHTLIHKHMLFKCFYTLFFFIYSRVILQHFIIFICI